MTKKDNGLLRITEERFDRLAIHLLQFKWYYLVFILLLVCLAIPGLYQLRFNTSIEDWFPKQADVSQNKEQFNRQFGNSDYVGLLIEADSIFQPRVLRMIDSLSRDLEQKVPYAREVISITNVEYSYAEGKRIIIEELVPNPVPEHPDTLRQIQKNALSKEMIAGDLINRSTNRTLLILRLNSYPDNWESKHTLSPENRVGRAVKQIIEQPEYSDYSIKSTGWPIMAYEELNYTLFTSSRFMLYALLVAIIFLILFLRTFRGVIIPFTCTLITLLLVFGYMGYMDIRVNAFLFSVPVVLLLAVSVGYSVHLFNYFHRSFRKGGRRYRAIRYAVKKAGWPILFTALTTVGALLSFVVIKLIPIRWLGLTSASLVLVGYVSIMILTPILLSFGKDRKPSERAGEELFKSDRYFKALGRWIFRHKRGILAASLVGLLIFLYGLTRVEININARETYGTDVPYIDRMIQIAETNIGSFNNYDITLKFPEDNAAKNPEILDKFSRFQDYIRKLPLTEQTHSVLNILKDMNRLVHGNRQKYYRIPDRRNLAAQLYLLYEMSGGAHLSRWLAENYSLFRLQVRTRELDARETIREIKQIRQKARQLFPKAELNITGGMPEYATLNNYVANGQIKSFFMAVIVIGVLMMFVFNSITIGVIGLIPSIFPAIVIGGVMGLTGIPLDFLTVTIAPMLLGLSVDDTIHFIDHLIQSYHQKGSYRQATCRSLQVVGRALLMTSLIIIFSFSVYTTANMNLMVHLGFLIMLGIFTALITDYLLAPILIRWADPINRSDEKDKSN